MILETLRTLTDYLGDATNGVNAKLAGVPRSGGDTAPPNVALIADETRSEYAAIGRLPDLAPSYPCLLVSQPPEGNVLDPHAKVGVHDGTVAVLIRYAVLEKTAAKGTRGMLYTFRAVQRTLEEWFRGSDAARTQNSVTVWFCESMRIVPSWVAVGDKVVTGGMFLTFKVRDTAPVS